MIRTVELTKRYGPTLALDRLSLEVPPGAVFGLLGPNGAGKTTFLRLVMGFVFPDAGQIDRPDRSPASIGYLPERAFYPPRFTVREYLTTVGQMAGLRGNALRQALGPILQQFGLQEFAGRRLGACSRGVLQRLGLAQAMVGDPPLLLLDEPARGLDPAGQKFMRDQILDLHHSGKTVVLSSHHLEEVTRTCTHVGVLNRGRLVCSGPLEALLAPYPQLNISPVARLPGLRQITIITDPMPADLISRLTSLAPGILASEQWVTLTGEAVDRKAEVLRLLLNAGVDIQQLGEPRTSLEDLYLEATRE